MQAEPQLADPLSTSLMSTSQEWGRDRVVVVAFFFFFFFLFFELCGRVETLGHCLGGCTHTLMSQMYSKRHGHAVNKIATSIQHGIKGACPIFYDAEGHNRSARQLPQWLPPPTHARIQHTRHHPSNRHDAGTTRRCPTSSQHRG
jgi:hypothetical protein